MDIDLDAFFGGQGATDLDDYDEVDAPTAQPTVTIDLDSCFDGQSATDLDNDDYDDNDADDEVDAPTTQPIFTIDLDSCFDGQSATDLDNDDDDNTTAVEGDNTTAESSDFRGYFPYTHADKVFENNGNEVYIIINAPDYQPSKNTHLARNAAGKLITWDGVKVLKPAYRPSPLRQVENAAECIEESMTPMVTAAADCESSSYSSSSEIDTDADTDTPPSSPEAPSTPTTSCCPPLSLLGPIISTNPIIDTNPIINTEPIIDTEPIINTEPIISTEPIHSTTKPSEIRSEYAGTYAAIIIGISVVLSLW